MPSLSPSQPVLASPLGPNVRGAALGAGRAGNQGANVNVGYSDAHSESISSKPEFARRKAEN